LTSKAGRHITGSVTESVIPFRTGEFVSVAFVQFPRQRHLARRIPPSAESRLERAPGFGGHENWNDDVQTKINRRARLIIIIIIIIIVTWYIITYLILLYNIKDARRGDGRLLSTAKYNGTRLEVVVFNEWKLLGIHG